MAPSDLSSLVLSNAFKERQIDFFAHHGTVEPVIHVSGIHLTPIGIGLVLDTRAVSGDFHARKRRTINALALAVHHIELLGEVPRQIELHARLKDIDNQCGVCDLRDPVAMAQDRTATLIEHDSELPKLGMHVGQQPLYVTCQGRIKATC